MDGRFRAMLTKQTRPISMSAIQKMRKSGLFRDLGDEVTCDRHSIRINPQNDTNDNDKVCAVLIPGKNSCVQLNSCRYEVLIMFFVYLFTIL